MSNRKTFECTNCGEFYIVSIDDAEKMEKAPCPECDECAISQVKHISVYEENPDGETVEHTVRTESNSDAPLTSEKTAADLYYRVSRYDGR